jgi:mannose-1-phosphate guanylyltransferase / mannose-6-phosphate isomerase
VSGVERQTPRIVPVVLAGGSGARLWPLSTAAKPKPFLPLLDGRSTFQETLARVTSIPQVDTVLVVINEVHRELVEAEVHNESAEIHLLLEPASRDSAAAIGAAAEWLTRHRPGVVAAFVSADHHIPDQAAFVAALQQAARGAFDHQIVALGLKPDSPSTAFGYIRPLPDGRPLARIGAFIEKPDRPTAERYISAGYLWNSGNFICRPEALLAELTLHAPEVAMFARAAVASAREEAGTTSLGPEFVKAPATSIDRALMERTTEAAVLPVGFSWSDIGSWRAVLEASRRDAALNSVIGDALLQDCTGCLVRTPPGFRLAMIGLNAVAVVATEDGKLLVCDLGSAEDVRLAANHFPRQ